MTHVFRRNGKPIRKLDSALHKARIAASVPPCLLHDTRRTAVRNFERASVSRSVAMKITVHQTESVYRRYAIVSDRNLRDGVAARISNDKGTNDRIGAGRVA